MSTNNVIELFGWNPVPTALATHPGQVPETLRLSVGPDGDGGDGGDGGTKWPLKTAVTPSAAPDVVSVQGFVWPAQASVHESKVNPEVGYAVSVTSRPASKGRMQASGQSMR
jgi:hypothetical protein